MNKNLNEKLIEEGKVFPTIDYEDTIFYIIFTLSLLIWGILISIYIYTLWSSKYDEDNKFIWVLGIIALYPIYIFINSINIIAKDKTLLSLSPFFPICIDGYHTLTQKEKDLNIIGKIDYECWQKQHKYLFESSNLITNKSNYSIRILFTIIVFLFGLGKISTFQYKIITKNNRFVKSLIQGAAICGIVLIGSRFLAADLNYITLIFNTFFTNLVHINIATLMILIAYLLYNLFIAYF